MNIALGRTVAGLLGLFAAVLAFQTIRTNAWLPITIASGSFEVTAALLAFWFAARGHVAGERAMFKRVLLAGVIAGGVALLAGVLGPLVLSPGAQGPLLGIFITGPAGFAAGCIVAFIWVGIASRQFL
jgi:uncharacterized membrane protein